MSSNSVVPIPTLVRIATLYKTLLEAEQQGVSHLNSAQFESLTGIPSAQIRQDLSLLKHKGKPGVGYEVSKLKKFISETLHIHHPQKFALIGAGRLGQALANYPGLIDYNFVLTSIFDNDPKKIGTKIKSIPIQDIQHLPKFIKKNNIKIAVITVPASQAQLVADIAMRSGIQWILNFSPVHLKTKKGCYVRDVSFTQEFAVLSHFVRP